MTSDHLFTENPALPADSTAQDNTLSFFHDATMLICGTQDIHDMLKNILIFLLKSLPLDAIGLSCFEAQISSVRRFALYTREGHYEEESLEYIPAAPLRFANSMVSTKHDVVLTESAADNPIRSFLNDCGKSPYQSALVLHLYNGEQHIGFVDIFAKKERQFTQEHADLVRQLILPFTLYLINFLHIQELKQQKTRIEEENIRLKTGRQEPGSEIIGFSSGLARIRQLADDVAPTSTPVLLMGETGTGKDILADYIQQQSQRANKPFIKVNCAAIPEHLIENEFFGHDACAYTGAKDTQQGRFERANKGTIFLDEIGELPPGAQAKLLRVLENKEIERLGGSRSIPVDVRILAATNQSLPDLVDQGIFRRDLFYRLNVFPIHLPTLRERHQDIPRLIHFFLKKKAQSLGLSPLAAIPAEEMKIMLAHSWPGNIRELSNVIERALINCQHTGSLHFDLDISRSPKPAMQNSFDCCQEKQISNDIPTLDEAMRRHILSVLQMTNGKIMGLNGAAEILGINGYTLRKRMLKLGIDPKKRH